MAQGQSLRPEQRGRCDPKQMKRMQHFFSSALVPTNYQLGMWWGWGEKMSIFTYDFVYTYDPFY